MILADLIVPLLLDATQYTKGMDDAQSKATGVADGLSKIGGTVVAGALGLAATGVASLTTYLGLSVKAASEAEGIQADLAATLKSTGGAAGLTADEINNMAENLSNVTKFEDDAIVSGQSMLLTFTNIGKNVFPQASEAMLNLSQKMGTDLQSSATQLGKALNDPINGITALTRVGVTFTDEQKKMIQQMQEAGDVEGAQKVILAELEKEFGGVARAAGQTTAGKFEILKNKLGNISETLGNKLLPVLALGAEKFSTWLSNPVVQAQIDNVLNAIGALATNVITYIPQIITFLGQIPAWLQANQPVVVGVLAALGVAVAAFVWTTAIPSLIALGTTFLVTFGPALLVMAAVGVAVGLLYAAWQSNFGGIRDFLTAVWEEKLKPAFEQIKQWLSVNIPIAIDKLKQFWTGTMIPALQAVWSFLQTNIFPIFTTLRDWLATNLPVAVKALSDFWNNTLKPALQGIWAFIQDPLLPLFSALWELLKVAGKVAIDILAGLWKNVLQPALKDVWSFIQDKIFPVLQTLWEWFKTKLGGPIESITGKLDGLKSVLKDVKDFIQGVIDKVLALATKLSNIKLPPWVERHSPSPFEMTFIGAGQAIDDLNKKYLPNLNSNLNRNNFEFGAKDNSAEIIRAIRENKNTKLDERKLARLIGEAVRGVLNDR